VPRERDPCVPSRPAVPCSHYGFNAQTLVTQLCELEVELGPLVLTSELRAM